MSKIVELKDLTGKISLGLTKNISAAYFIFPTDKIFKISPNDWYFQKDYNVSARHSESESNWVVYLVALWLYFRDQNVDQTDQLSPVCHHTRIAGQTTTLAPPTDTLRFWCWWVCTSVCLSVDSVCHHTRVARQTTTLAPPTDTLRFWCWWVCTSVCLSVDPVCHHTRVARQTTTIAPPTNTLRFWCWWVCTSVCLWTQFVITRGLPDRPRRSPLRPIRLDSDVGEFVRLSVCTSLMIVDHRSQVSSIYDPCACMTLIWKVFVKILTV